MATFWDQVAGFYDKFVNVFDWHGDQLRIAEDITSGSVMEVCCGTGYLTMELLKRGVDAYGTDIAPKMIAKARKTLAAEGLDPERVSVADVTELPFEDGRFDYVFSTGALGLFSDDLKRAALAEMMRVCCKAHRIVIRRQHVPGYTAHGYATGGVSIGSDEGPALQRPRQDTALQVVILTFDNAGETAVPDGIPGLPAGPVVAEAGVQRWSLRCEVFQDDDFQLCRQACQPSVVGHKSCCLV